MELGVANTRPGLWHPSRLEQLESAFLWRKGGLVDETVPLEALATSKKATSQFLRRCGFSAQQATDMVYHHSARRPDEVIKSSLFLCGKWCRNRTATSWALT